MFMFVTTLVFIFIITNVVSPIVIVLLLIVSDFEGRRELFQAAESVRCAVWRDDLHGVPVPHSLCWQNGESLCDVSSHYHYYASPTSGEAYRDRRLTTNFELWVEIFCVSTCFHVKIPKPCLSVCPSVRPSVHLSVPREKKSP